MRNIDDAQYTNAVQMYTDAVQNYADHFNMRHNLARLISTKQFTIDRLNEELVEAEQQLIKIDAELARLEVTRKQALTDMLMAIMRGGGDEPAG